MNDQGDEIIMLRLPLSVINAALNGLGEMPAKLSMKAINAITAEAQRAIDEKNAPKITPVETVEKTAE